MMRSVDARMVEFGGTFVPDNHGNRGNVMASAAFMPEVLEEETRLAGRRRYLDIEDIPEAEAIVPRFIRIGTLEEALTKLLSISPEFAFKVYQKARYEESDGAKSLKILVTLPKVVRALLASGIYSASTFQMKSNRCYYAAFKACPIAREIVNDLKAAH